MSFVNKQRAVLADVSTLDLVFHFETGQTDSDLQSDWDHSQAVMFNCPLSFSLKHLNPENSRVLNFLLSFSRRLLKGKRFLQLNVWAPTVHDDVCAEFDTGSLVGVMLHQQLSCFSLQRLIVLLLLCNDRAEGRSGGQQQLPEQRESLRHHQRPARPALLPPREQLHGDEVRRAQRASVHRDQPAAVQHGHLTQRWAALWTSCSNAPTSYSSYYSSFYFSV